VHYNGGYPTIPKGQDILPRRVSDFPSVITFTRATKRLLVGIIDCAFENSENLLLSVLLLRLAFLKIFACTETLNPNSWKDFPQNSFQLGRSEMSGGFSR
jgi:hypothetical protein